MLVRGYGGRVMTVASRVVMFVCCEIERYKKGLAVATAAVQQCHFFIH